MIISSSKALRIGCLCTRKAARCAHTTAADADAAPGNNRKNTTWQRALPEGRYALYDLALESLERCKTLQLAQVEKERKRGSKSEKELVELESLAWARDPETLWRFENGRSDYSSPVYRSLRENRWRKSGDLARIMQKLHDNLVIPDLFPSFDADVELLVRFGEQSNPDFESGMLPGRPLHPDKVRTILNCACQNVSFAQTLMAPHLRTFVPHDGEQLYTLALVDPDAPDEERVTFQEKWHWLRVNVPLSPTLHDPTTGGETILPYVPPHPERGTPRHRYVLVLAAQSRSIDTSEPYPRLGQLLWRSYLERQEARMAGAFHWICTNNDYTRQAVSEIYKTVLKMREPQYVKNYKVNAYRLYGAVGRTRQDI